MPGKFTELMKGRQRVAILLAVFVVLVIGILIIGLDNIPGLILGYLATAVLMMELVHGWRKIRNFITLLAVSLFGIIFLSFLYVEVIYRLAEMIGGINAAQSTAFAIIHVIITNVILFAGPVGMFTGIAGAIILGISRLPAVRIRNGAANNT